MSLVGTLGRIAVGIAVAKGVGSLVNRGRSTGGTGSTGSNSGLGGLLGGMLGGGAGGGLGGALGGALGGQQSGQQDTQLRGGGLGDLGALLGGKAGGSMSGGLGGLLESIAGGAGGAAAGGATAPTPPGGSLGDLLNSALQGNKIPEPEPAQEDLARILIQAMVNAAKSDGEIDQTEQQKIVANLGDEVSDAERQFVISEMRSPLDLQGFLKAIPRGAEMQVYMMSLLAIDLDHQHEAQYLDNLRKGIGMSEDQANAIHQKLGVPTLYS
ncbi:MAG: tellurite resistance TerB family protein [Granulosicoccus sp.]|nr:tellurite resistance TerB family protein [Granulosicoccus sp.]